jgi:DUF177 domain-containing protein
MDINLSKIFYKDKKVYYFEGELDEESLHNITEEFKIIGPVVYKGEIYKMQGEYLINVDIKYTYSTQCDRCLKYITKKANTTLSGKLIEEDVDELTEDENLIYYENGFLDLNNYISMEIISSLPMKSLCDEECKGICQRCGKDLNDGECNCEDEDIDPRFEKLKNFLLKE